MEAFVMALIGFAIGHTGYHATVIIRTQGYTL